MSSHNDHSVHEHSNQSFWDKWWPLFLILFGISFVLFLISFSPRY